MINDFPQTLTIAGTDSGGGAGIMADLKTMQERHVFGTAVVVAVTAQNTLGVQDFMAIPSKLIDEQFASLADDLKIRACKTGMLADSERVNTVAKNLQKYDFGPVVVDPVMIAKGGAALLAESAIQTVKEDLLPLATLLTPNIPEAEKLSGVTIRTGADMETAAKKLQSMGAKNVLVKGGHELNPETSNDFALLADSSSFWLKSKRFDTKRTHGTGDTISSCITAELAKGANMEAAIRTGKDFVEAAITTHPIQVGHGHGPLNHWAYDEEEVKHS